MKKNVLFMVLLTVLLVFPFNIKAFCYSKDKVKFQKLAENINYTYVFDENSKTFYIYFTNVSQSIAINGNVYSNSEVVLSGFLPGNSYKFVVKTNDINCFEEELKNIYVTLPMYNSNYTSSLCEGLEKYDICQKWGKYISDQTEFEKQINKIKTDITEIAEIETTEEYKGMFNYLAEFFVNSYYIILPIIIIGGIFCIYKLNKKDKLF